MHSDGRGKIRPALGETEAKTLPEEYPEDIKEALAHPEEDLLGTAVGTGRLLRSGDGGKVVASMLRKWIRNLDMESIAIIGGAAESISADNLELLYRYSKHDHLAARAIKDELGEIPAQTAIENDDVDTEILPIDQSETGDQTHLPLNSNWAVGLVCSRDDVESLLYFLGVAATEQSSEAISVYERGAMDLARQVDRVAEAISDLIADALPAIKKTSEWRWLERIAPIGDGCWWLDILHAWSHQGLSVPREVADRDDDRNREALVTEYALAAGAVEPGKTFFVRTAPDLGRLEFCRSAQGQLLARLIPTVSPGIALTLPDRLDLQWQSQEGEATTALTRMGKGKAAFYHSSGSLPDAVLTADPLIVRGKGETSWTAAKGERKD